MICHLFPEPTYFIFSAEVPGILYYAQIPATIIALILSLYAFWNGRHLLLNQLLLAISVTFSFWTFFTMIAWTNIHSQIIMFVWSFFGLILGLISIFCIYFIYVFLKKKDISFKLKIVLLSLLIPVIFLAPTSLNIKGFDLTYCDAFNYEWLPFKIYGSSLGILAMVWILFLLIKEYCSATPEFKRAIMLMGMGIELFLFSFFGMEFLATYLTKLGFLPDSGIELYGLFGMVIFMIYISILMVNFKMFNVKLFATQALVWGLVILIGSQFFFIKVTTNFILNSITFISAIIFGSLLIGSVKKEIKQKEELAKLNTDLSDLLKQRESLVHLITHKVKGSFTRSKYIFAGLLDGTFGEMNPEVKKVAKLGLDSDNAGVETVDLVLNASNLQKGTVKYELKEMDFKKLVNEVLEDKASVIKEKGLELETHIEEGEFKVKGDAFWLKEVINNLVENSLRYTPKGKIAVSLEKKEKKLLFLVKDTGVGITDEDKQNLFTEGGRGKESVKVNVDSTGYGLYSVKLILDGHQGRVWAESAGPGQGATFFVELDLI